MEQQPGSIDEVKTRLREMRNEQLMIAVELAWAGVITKKTRKQMMKSIRRDPRYKDINN